MELGCWLTYDKYCWPLMTCIIGPQMRRTVKAPLIPNKDPSLLKTQQTATKKGGLLNLSYEPCCCWILFLFRLTGIHASITRLRSLTVRPRLAPNTNLRVLLHAFGLVRRSSLSVGASTTTLCSGWGCATSLDNWGLFLDRE